jgi:hypothetical protein
MTSFSPHSVSKTKGSRISRYINRFAYLLILLGRDAVTLQTAFLKGTYVFADEIIVTDTVAISLAT